MDKIEAKGEQYGGILIGTMAESRLGYLVTCSICGEEYSVPIFEPARFLCDDCARKLRKLIAEQEDE